MANRSCRGAGPVLTVGIVLRDHAECGAARIMDIESGTTTTDVHSTGCCRNRYVTGAGQRDIAKLAFDLSLVSIQYHKSPASELPMLTCTSFIALSPHAHRS
jgi:hypothetical protein